jgi:hypothetical protein
MSMSLILSYVRDAIHQDFRTLPAAGAKLILTETERDAKCTEVHISSKGLSFNGQPVLINLDRRDATGVSIDTHPIFTDIKGMKLKCDYALICPLGDKLYVLMIDLKSDTYKGWLHQSFASEQFTRYILANVERANECSIPYEIIYRHVVFTTNKGIAAKNKTGNPKAVDYEFESTKQIHFTQLPCTSKSAEGHSLKRLLC